MIDHAVVPHQEWIEARKPLLAKQKDLSRLPEDISQARGDLPWERVDTDYVFDGPNVQEIFSDLFDVNSQLIVYHFLFGLDWEEGCKSCSYMADYFNAAIIHRIARGITNTKIRAFP
ncbi:MAG: DUF899 family protein [Rhodospirillaceae bacterium]|nr:DUF899 family protein [Rhodospirillaceae bacterium]